MHKHTDLIMADIVCFTAIVLGIVRQADLTVSELCALDRSAEDTDLTHQPEYIAELIGLLAPRHLGVRRELRIRSHVCSGCTRLWLEVVCQCCSNINNVLMCDL